MEKKCRDKQSEPNLEAKMQIRLGENERSDDVIGLVPGYEFIPRIYVQTAFYEGRDQISGHGSRCHQKSQGKKVLRSVIDLGDIPENREIGGQTALDKENGHTDKYRGEHPPPGLVAAEKALFTELQSEIDRNIEILQETYFFRQRRRHIGKISGQKKIKAGKNELELG
jgi:hypothetical protein